MEAVDVRLLPPCEEAGLEISAEPQLRAISDRYAARGLYQSALDCAKRQIEKEEETRALAPEAYRLSTLSEATINGRYRLGKENMDTADLIRYFSEVRGRRIQNVDFSEAALVEEEILEETAVVAVEEKHGLSAQLKTLSVTAGERLKNAIPTWFNGEKPDTSREVRRFPLSAFAAVIAVAMSLMLIVASSVLLTRAESSIDRLRGEVSTLSAEVEELRSDLDVQTNLLEIRRIAIEEYGMVDEEYLKMQYISLEAEDKVEAFEEEREENISLSTLLSAIGIK